MYMYIAQRNEAQHGKKLFSRLDVDTGNFITQWQTEKVTNITLLL